MLPASLWAVSFFRSLTTTFAPVWPKKFGDGTADSGTGTGDNSGLIFQSKCAQ
jgi:hypothetical protein